MGLEAGTYLNDLVATNPVGATDPKSQGDDHLRLIKSVLRNTFPGLAGSAFRLQTKSADYTLVATDNMSVLVCTSALTLDLTAAATLGNKQMTVIICKGASVLLVPDGSDTINGESSLALSYNDAGLLFCDGADDFPFIQLGGINGSFTTGDIKASARATPEPGWLVTRGTIGDASSGATTRADADCEALFTVLWEDWADAQAPVSGGRGASAAADFAAHKRIGLPDIGGRVIAGREAAADRLSVIMTGSLLGTAAGNERQSTMDAPNLTQLVEGNAVDNPVNVAHQSHVHANTWVVQPTIVLNYFIKL